MNDALMATTVLGLVQIVKDYGVPSKYLPVLAVSVAFFLGAVEQTYPGFLSTYVAQAVAIGVSLTGGVGFYKHERDRYISTP